MISRYSWDNLKKLYIKKYETRRTHSAILFVWFCQANLNCSLLLIFIMSLSLLFGMSSPGIGEMFLYWFSYGKNLMYFQTRLCFQSLNKNRSFLFTLREDLTDFFYVLKLKNLLWNEKSLLTFLLIVYNNNSLTFNYLSKITILSRDLGIFYCQLQNPGICLKDRDRIP